jgi:hypothetical protein
MVRGISGPDTLALRFFDRAVRGHPSSPLSHAHRRLCGELGTRSTLAAAQIRGIFSLWLPRDRTKCAQKRFGIRSNAGCKQTNCAVPADNP